MGTFSLGWSFLCSQPLANNRHWYVWMHDHLEPLASPEQWGWCPSLFLFCSEHQLSWNPFYVPNIYAWLLVHAVRSRAGMATVNWDSFFCQTNLRGGTETIHYHRLFLLAMYFFQVLCSHQHVILFWLNESAEIRLFIYFSKCIRAEHVVGWTCSLTW